MGLNTFAVPVGAGAVVAADAVTDGVLVLAASRGPAAQPVTSSTAISSVDAVGCRIRLPSHPGVAGPG